MIAGWKKGAFLLGRLLGLSEQGVPACARWAATGPARCRLDRFLNPRVTPAEMVDTARSHRDTIGEQVQAEWLAPPASWWIPTQLTIVRLRAQPLDSAHGGHHVLLARFEFNPSPAEGDEYALKVALDLGDIRALQRATPYPLGRLRRGFPRSPP